ncbi:hypothetical protein [Variovorax sp. dw_954]|uniref:hypothetical protein n=1 Tax=Variovorax sp. dw_954 TaxID=2720078 RepID=UPI001BD46AF8|nr:hypothetical protein [Variovorax sp. dw_954]
MRRGELRLALAALTLAATGLLGACASAPPQLTPELVAHIGYQSLGPEMKLSDQMLTVWVPAPAPPADGTPPLSPEAFAALVAASSPMVSDLALVMARGASEPINLAIGGPDSALAAQILLRAFRALPAPVPYLRIAFVGRPVEVGELAATASMKGAALRFEMAPL